MWLEIENIKDKYMETYSENSIIKLKAEEIF